MAEDRYQNIIDALSDYVGCVVGTVNCDGAVSSCTVPELVGLDRNDSALAGFTFRDIDRQGVPLSAVFADRNGDDADDICGLLAFSVLSVSENGISGGKERFIASLLRDQSSQGESILNAEKFGILFAKTRVVIAVRISGETDTLPYQLLRRVFSEPDDFVVPMENNLYAVITDAGDEPDYDTLCAVAESVVDTFGSECLVNASAGIGSPAVNLDMLRRSYDDAYTALETVRIFGAGSSVLRYDSLGIEGLIRDIPLDTCKRFLSEIKGCEQLDSETLLTIQAFFDNGLNVSETARDIFVHRNTLLYRIEKIRRVTGLDIREFDQAVTLRIALLVRKYLDSLS